MGDQDDGFALFLEAVQDAEEVVGLVRGQHAGRLVKDQDIGLTVKRLEDLDPLLVADREVFDQRIWIDVKLVFARQIGQHAAGLGQRGVQERPVLGPQNDVFQHGEVLHQFEMLEHHTDAGADGGLTVGDGGELAVDENLARVGFVKAVEDRHQCRFPGTVFTDDAVNGAFRHGDVDVAVGLHGAEGLGDAFELDGGCGGFGAASDMGGVSATGMR